MGFATITMMFVVAVLLIISNTEAVGANKCPPPSKVYSRKICHDNYDCKNGQVCCPNQSNSKSCAEPAHGSASGYDNKYKGSMGGPGVYCGNVKCSPYEKCVKDPHTGKLVCRRA